MRANFAFHFAENSVVRDCGYAIDIVYIPSRTDTSGRARFPPRSVLPVWSASVALRRFREFPPWSASLYPRVLYDSIDPHHRYFPLRAFFLLTLSKEKEGVRERGMEGGRERERIACYTCFDSIILISSQAWHRERSERNDDYISHFCRIIHQEVNILVVAEYKSREKFLIFMIVIMLPYLWLGVTI